MTIRTRLSLLSVGLVAAVVIAMAWAVTASQRSTLEDQSRRRLAALTDGVSRLAQEAVENRDPLMLTSYLIHLRREHEELAFAAMTRRGHTSTLGEDKPGLVYWSAQAAARRPVTYTVTTMSSDPGSPSISTSAVTLPISENAMVTVSEEGRQDPLAFKLGFDQAVLDLEIARALGPLTRRTTAIAGVFMLLGWLGALSVSKVLTAPLTSLAAAVSAVKAGNLDVVVAAVGTDEVGRLAARFNEMTAHLKELTRFREDLLHTLTHELNTPLGGLKGYLELWQDRKLPVEGPERDDALITMSAAVVRMEDSLSGALARFRSGAPAAPAPAGIVRVDAVVREVCSLFAAKAAAKRITLSLPTADVKASLDGDPELLRRVVVNLVSNALKYTPDGGHVLVSLGGGAKRVRLQVSDTGRGIAPDDIPKLFTKFYRATPGAGQPAVDGTGLGLSIAQQAANALGGSIAVWSSLGSGSVFTATFPRRDA